MASGFIVLSDGSCASFYWRSYDSVVRTIAAQLNGLPRELELKNWLLKMAPREEEYVINLGDGSWIKMPDEALIERFIDIRELETAYQIILESAILSIPDTIRDKNTRKLVNMVNAIRLGDPPLSHSDWIAISKPRVTGRKPENLSC